jgi:hypothetical protein
MEKTHMNNKTVSQATRTARVRNFFAAALVLACAFGTVTHAAAQQVTAPTTPDTITPPVGNSAFLIGHARGSQGYTCLPTPAGGTSWTVNNARPEATLFTDIFGQDFQIITHFASINLNPKPEVVKPVPVGGNATWQSSLDSSRVWAVATGHIDPSAEIPSCSHEGSIQCLVLQSVGNLRGTTGGRLLADVSFIQRLNTNGGSAPTTACTVGQTVLVPYTADYVFFRADR